MYNITLYENGVFCTNIGGTVPTLPEAIKQIQTIAKSLDATELEEYFGVKFDRAGTVCALLVTDRWGSALRNEKNEEE